MSKDIVINSTSYETRVAILEDGELAEIFIEREEDRASVGNIYKGRVQKVLPGMQSAFINIGLDRDAFLYVTDVFSDWEEYESWFSTDKEEEEEEEEHEAAPAPAEPAERKEEARKGRPRKPAAEPSEAPAQAEPPGEKRRRRGKRGGRGRGKKAAPQAGAAPQAEVAPRAEPAPTAEAAPTAEGAVEPAVGIGEAGAPVGPDGTGKKKRRRRGKRGGRGRRKAAPADQTAEPVRPAEPERREEAPGTTDGAEGQKKRRRRGRRGGRGRRRKGAGMTPVAEGGTGPHPGDAGEGAPGLRAEEEDRGTDAGTAGEEGRKRRSRLREAWRRLFGAAGEGEERGKGEEDGGNGGGGAQRMEATPGKEAPKSRRGGRGSGKRTSRRKPKAIEDLLKEGQEILVQVNREPIGQKGARITSHITLPGKYLVLMPTVEHLGVSKKIGDFKERRRLRQILQEIRRNGIGCILRTAASAKSLEEIKEDYDRLIEVWQRIKEKADKAKAPALVHSDLTAALRVLRDHLTEDVESVAVDDGKTFEECREFVRRHQPGLENRVKHFQNPAVPIFDKYGIEEDIERSLRPRVWLKSGGYLVINQMEAMVAIDVNTGKYVGKNKVEGTILKTNLEAVREAARQIRLRDLGGIIVIDFIDMMERSSRRQVQGEIDKEFRKDRAKSTILPMSEFGLVEITRQRLKRSIEKILTQPCPYCAGCGRVKSYYTIGAEIERHLQRLRGKVPAGREIVVRTHPETAEVLNERFFLLQDMEEALRTRITVETDPTLHREQYEIVAG